MRCFSTKQCPKRARTKQEPNWLASQYCRHRFGALGVSERGLMSRHFNAPGLRDKNPYGFKGAFNPTLPGGDQESSGRVSPWHLD